MPIALANGPDTPSIAAGFNGKHLTALVFCGIFFLLLSMSPGGLAQQGYAGEEIQAGSSVLDRAASLLTGQPARAISYTRHGALPLVYDAPWLIAARFCPDTKGCEDRLASCRPVFFTAGLATLVFLWTWRLTARPGWSLAVALLSLFTTLLWPYAYMGMEDTQSFFLLLAAYLAFERDPLRRWPSTLGFACACACAISTKSTGVCLIPAVTVVLIVAGQRAARRSAGRIAFVAVFVAIVFSLSAYSRIPYWAPAGGSRATLVILLIGDPISFVSNMASLFFSGNKGLFIYCPILIFAAIGLPALWRDKRKPLVLFAVLGAGGLACGFSLLKVWSDETWGPRYLHSCIAPLMVCFGIAWARRSKATNVLIGAAACLGLMVAFLGSFFPYGQVQAAMTKAGQDTLESIQGDVVWNPIRFHARLFEIWITQSSPVMLTPAHQWFYDAPAGAQAWPAIRIDRYAVAQPYLIRWWWTRLSGAALWYRRALEFSLLLGLLLMALAITSSRRTGARTQILEAAGPAIDGDAGSVVPV